MKTSIKYLLLAAIGGFAFLNVSNKKLKKIEQQIPVQSTQTMPDIPNGDFEQWENEHTYIGGHELKKWRTNSLVGSASPYERHIVIRDSINVYRGKYSAKMIMNAWAENKFPISIHPSSLHCHVRLLIG